MGQIIEAIGFGIVTASAIALGAVGFSMQFSISRIFNVSYGAIMTICAFVAYYVDIDLHTNFWVGLLAGAIAGGVLAVASERLLFSPFQRRRAGMVTLVMVALALDAFAQNAVIAVAGPGFFSYSLPPETIYHFLGMYWTSLELTVVAIALIAMVFLHLLLKYSKLGKTLRATASDSELAGASGINVRATRTIGWAISGVLCGLGGVILVANTASFNFLTGDGFEFVVFAAAVVGGIGQPYGAMLGALVIGLATEEAAIWIPSLEYVVAFVLLAIVLLVRPGGIIQLSSRQRKDAIGV